VHKYVIFMRTTLILDDQLIVAAKQKAASRHTTLSGVVNDALRLALFQPAAAPVQVFTMPVFDGGIPLSHSPQDLAALRDEGR
jgi:hypothetical protein